MDAALKLMLSGAVLLLALWAPHAGAQPELPPPAPYTEGDKALLPKAECPGQSFSSLVEKECGSPSGPRDGKAAECEAGLATRELQSAILDRADTQCIAQILIETASVSGIEAGFRIPPEVNFVEKCGSRNKDPDVAALKGLLLGTLLAGDTDSGLIPKLVAGLVPSFTPPEGSSAPPPQKTPSPSVIPAKTPSPPGKRKGGNCFTVTVTRNGEVTEETSNCTPESSPEPTPMPTSKPTPKPTPNPKEFVDPDVFEASLRNRTLLFATFTADPNKDPPCASPPPTKGGRRLATLPGLDMLLSRGQGRDLQCSSCDNADSYVCAYCWRAGFCSQFYWCS